MNERYTRLAALPDELYLEGAPVLIVAGALLKDGKTGRVLAQLKLRNLYGSKLNACKVSVRAFDPGGEELVGVREYAYLDLDVAIGEDFASQGPDTASGQYDAEHISQRHTSGLCRRHGLASRRGAVDASAAEAPKDHVGIRSGTGGTVLHRGGR